MNLLYIVLAALLVVAVLTFVGPWVNQKIAEPFQGSSGGCPVLPPTQADVLPPSPDPDTFQRYIDRGRLENNKTAGMLTDTQVSDLSRMSWGPTSINEQLRQALTTSMVQPTVPERAYTDTRTVEPVYGPSMAQGILRSFAGIIGYKVSETSGSGPDMTQPWTFFDQKPSYVEESIPTVSNFRSTVETCEKVNAFTADKKNREQLCRALNGSLDATCGVCLKGGNTYTTDTSLVGKLTKFIGGMFLSERDRYKQRAATAVGRATAYKPSAGTCADGYFFVAGQEDACLNAARKLACEEYGVNGGFDASGSAVVTDDGLTATNMLGKCAACQQNPNTYLVSGGGSQPLRVRIVVPTGTGTTVVFYRQGSETVQSQRISAGDSVSLQFPRVQQTNDVLEFEVFQEFPHRPRGDEEVFFAAGTFADMSGARAYCENLGATVATLDQLQQAYNAGAQVCPGGYAADGNVYTIHQYADYTTDSEGCSSNGIGVRDVSGAGGVWCYGIRPANGFYADATRETDTVFTQPPKILNWFNYIKRTNDALLNEEDKQPRYSRFGDIADRANYRGILVQMESGTDVVELQRRRRDAAERYIVNVGDTEITDYTLNKKLREYYSRNGLFSNSLKITAPRPDSPKMSNIPLIASQYWLWSTDHTSNLFKFKVQVPGYFRDPEFAEDLANCPTGILFTDGASLKRGTPSACENGPTNTCLSEIFSKVGGNPAAGDLGPDNAVNGTVNRKVLRYKDFVLPSGAYSALSETSLTLRTVDEVEAYLQAIADNAAGKNMPPKMPGEEPDSYNKRVLEIMQRAQRNLRGSAGGGPCDTLTYRDGRYEILKKETLDLSGSMDTTNQNIQCLQSLYTDKNTYTALGDAYSGISDTEIAASFVRNAFPFQACQPAGTWAPIKADGSVDPTVISAIASAARSFAPGNGVDISGVQRVFADIHAKANTTTTDVAVQKEAMERCYGIVRKELPSNCLGIQTKMIRVLPSAYRYNSPLTGCEGAIRIREGGITVKNASGICVGTPTYTAVYNLLTGSTTLPNFAGGQYVDKVSTGDYDVKRSKVELSFGELKTVQAIDYTVPTAVPTSCAGSVVGMVFQILDDAAPRKVMVQKVIRTISDLSSVNLVFNTDDMVPTIPYSSIVTGLEFRLETAIYPDMYFRKAESGSPSLDTRLTQDSVFVIKDDINGSTRVRVCSIFHKKTATYLSYNPATNSLIYIPKDDANITRRSWASWSVQPALNGSPAHVVLESANYPGKFLMPTMYDTFAGNVGVDIMNFESDFDKFRACWSLKPTD